MPSRNAPSIAPGRAIPINEASVVTGISVRKINGLIDDEILPKSVRVKGNRKALRALAMPMVRFGASDGAKLNRSLRLEAMRRIEKFARENWPRLCRDPEHAECLRLESGCIVVSLGTPIREAMAGLNRLADAETRVVEDPEIRGDIPVMRGTRIGVHEVADALAGDGMDVALEDFPALSREDVEAAALHAKAHPRAKVRPRTGRPRASGDPRRLVSERVLDPATVA